MPGKVFTMKTKITTRPAETVSRARTAITDRAKSISPDVDRPDPETPTQTAENDLSSDERLKRAAMPCPEEFRPAYIHLLKMLEADNRDVLFEDAPPIVHFERSVLILLVNTPDLDPWDMAEITDCFPECREFSEQLRMLSRLRQREHV